jgi:hypothetical protein
MGKEDIVVISGHLLLKLATGDRAVVPVAVGILVVKGRWFALMGWRPFQAFGFLTKPK